MENFGERFRHLRESKGITQQQIADLIGIKSGKQTISRWEKGLSEPSVSEVVKICEILETTVSYLIEGKPIQNTPPVVSEPPAGYILKSAEAELKEKEEKLQLQRELIEYQRKMLKTKDAELHEQKS